MKNIFLSMCFILALTGCSDYHKAEQGYVVKMEYVPEHSECYYDICLKIPMTRVVPERHFIWLADSVEVEKIEISKDGFDTLRVGSYLSLN